MEQSLYLQAQHLSAMDKFEKDLTKATEDSLLTHALHKSRLEETDANKKSKVPLKGILKKPRGYVLKTDMVTAWKANVNFFLFVEKYGLDTDLSQEILFPYFRNLQRWSGLANIFSFPYLYDTTRAI